MEGLMNHLFLAQQQAALNHYNRERDAGRSPTPGQPSPPSGGSANPPSNAAPPAGAAPGPTNNIFSMLQGVMESMSEGVIPNDGPSTQQPEGGPPPASQKTLRTIPLITVGEDDLTDDTNKECCICLEANEIGSTVKRLPCGHLFHPECIDSWIQKHCTCPVCRYELETDDASYNRGRNERMKGRRPRYHLYELKRMTAKEVMAMARDLKVSVTGAIDKSDIVERILASGKIDIIKGNSAASSKSYSIKDLEEARIKQLKVILDDAGVRYKERDVVERRDLIDLIVNSGRVEIVAEETDEDEILDIDGDEDDDDMDSKPRAVDLASESNTDGDCGPSELKRQRTQDEENEEEGQMDVDDLGSSGMKVEDLKNMKISELKKICKENAIDVSDCVEKKELVSRIVNSGTVLIADF
mmetsp:Transcript_25796/g.48562  ORF Transcript_25796/g.48562 Transcript_25796/m.48562 type:complete len:413 (-) Transcript_25796:144-1382(-)|eukprot:CAMPEP_0182501172 /NCGR_PEP_ID=MMETSP1321-20130603/10801_1 /TAXON_ID=91990 /ORGANISM="Bolidomonas sp., Strain RCC1657" /LENGTH=412 /DNA_ID=CAMNT_0024705785 /DNA_START=210 /DNA_END=1448 /DNA_ORIENTATION=+